MEVDRNGLEVLTRQQCLALVRTAHVGRVALTVDALPVVVPVNFALDGDDVVLRTGEGTKLSAAVRGAVVTFEVDHVDPTYHEGWSVCVTGPATAITDPDELATARRLPLRPWAGDAGHFVRISPKLVSGRRLSHGVV